MRTKLINNAGEKTFAIVFDKGDEVVTSLLMFAKQENLSASHFTAIGAFESVTFGFFERDRKDYKKIEINEQVEVMSLVGNIAPFGDELKLHAHVVVGKADGTAHGGHLIEARVWPTLEVFLIELPGGIQREIDEETGLPLISL